MVGVVVVFSRDDVALPLAVVLPVLVWKILAILVEVEVEAEEVASSTFGELSRTRFVAGVDVGTVGVEAGAAKNLFRDVCCLLDDMAFEGGLSRRNENGEREKGERNASRVCLKFWEDQDREITCTLYTDLLPCEVW